MLIGIDLGTTGLKAAAYDPDDGNCLAEASVRLPVQTDSDGRRDLGPRSTGPERGRRLRFSVR